jgi:sugar phosphate isomerase/epimerase
MSAIAAQMYTLREFTKTPADIAKTLKRVKQLGYDAVQMSGHGAIEAKELANILRGEGLQCVATHLKLDAMKNAPAVIEDHRILGCKYTAIGGFFLKEASAKDWYDFAKTYNDVAKQYEGSGLTLGYHNHSHELWRAEGKKTALDVLIEKLDPKIWFEIDTYWITHGGGDPVQWINKVAGRLPCVHLKDMGIKLDRTQFMAEVGEGNLNWSAILPACKKAGVEWYIVEQDTCYRDPFESLGISLKNLREMGIQ